MLVTGWGGWLGAAAALGSWAPSHTYIYMLMYTFLQGDLGEPPPPGRPAPSPRETGAAVRG